MEHLQTILHKKRIREENIARKLNVAITIGSWSFGVLMLILLYFYLQTL